MTWYLLLLALASSKRVYAAGRRRPAWAVEFSTAAAYDSRSISMDAPFLPGDE
jgi:hypothetical protein